MKVKEVTLSKEYKCGLPNFSNITTSISMTWEVDETEVFDFNAGWDVINQQLTLQGKEMDQSWMKVTDLKDATKVTVKIPKSSTGP